MIDTIYIVLAAIGGVLYGAWRLFSSGKKQGAEVVESKRRREENEANRRVADAKDANRSTSYDDRRKRMFGESRDE